MLISRKEAAANQLSLTRIGSALAVSVLGYGVISFQSPAAWGQLIWGLVVFLVLPLLVGALAGTSVMSGTDPQRKKRFWRAFWVASITVGVYTIVGLGITRSKMQSSDKSLDFAIFFVVVLVYGAIAGVVAGFAGSNLVPKRKAS